PRTRRSAKVSNLMPRSSSKRFAASINPSTPSWTRSPMSIEFGIVDAIRLANDSTKGSPATMRRLWLADADWDLMPARYRNRGTHGFERAQDDLRGAGAVHVVGRFRLEQLGVREDDPQLVVEAVEKEPKFREFVHRAPRQQFLDAERTRHHAWFRPSACHIVC